MYLVIELIIIEHSHFFIEGLFWILTFHLILVDGNQKIILTIFTHNHSQIFVLNGE